MLGCGGAAPPMAESAASPGQPGMYPAAKGAPMAAPMATGAPADQARMSEEMGPVPPPPPPSIAGGAAKDGAPSPKPTGLSSPVQMGGPSVKAGEWDDNANYREFQAFLTTQGQLGFHRVDASSRQFLVVRDVDGKAVPRCEVDVRDSAGHLTKLVTTASGRAILFPHAEGMTGDALTASATCSGATARKAFSTSVVDGVIDLQLTSKRKLASRDVDLAFILDTTGSMSEEIAAVKSTIQKVASSLAGEQVKIRVGLVEYKDRTDPFVTKVYPFSTDLAKFQSTVSSISASGGGDIPESMNEGIHVGLTKLEWNKGNAAVKMAFVIADAPPHLDYQQDADYAVDMKDASHRGIQMFTVAASGMDDLGQVVFRQIAQYTGATNLFVLRGGAGPQSTGGGDPKSSCGGTQTQYSSGNLDGLIVQKVRRELKALDRDPLQIAGLKEDENAKPCDKRLMIAE
jgi:hypothetical protein